MRAGSRSSAEPKLGFSHINPHTSAVKTITIRINPGIARKPKRRSSLSSRGIARTVKERSLRARWIALSSTAWQSMRLSRLIFAPSANPLPSSSKKPIHLCMQSLRRLIWRVSEEAPNKTPLYDEHVRLGARMVPFAGWLMPVQYLSIVEEHQAVRNNVGIFDISHMGKLIVDGTGACAWLNTMLTNNVGKLDVGTGQYTFLLNELGGIIDDLIVYRIGEQKFLLVVNAARANEDFEWLQGHLPAVYVVLLTTSSAD